MIPANQNLIPKELPAGFVNRYCIVCKDETSHKQISIRFDNLEVCVRCKIVSFPGIEISKKDEAALPAVDKGIVASR